MTDEERQAARRAALAGDEAALDRYVHAAAPDARSVSEARALRRAALVGDDEALRIYVDRIAPGLLTIRQPPTIQALPSAVVHRESERRRKAWTAGLCPSCGLGKGSTPCWDPEHAPYACAHAAAAVSGRDRRDVQYHCPDCTRTWWR